MRRTDGGSNGGVRGRGGCRWIEQLAVKGVGCVRARRRRSTASRGEPENGSEEGFAGTQRNIHINIYNSKHVNIFITFNNSHTHTCIILDKTKGKRMAHPTRARQWRSRLVLVWHGGMAWCGCEACQGALCLAWGCVRQEEGCGAAYACWKGARPMERGYMVMD